MFKISSLIEIATALKQESKCAKHKVACVIAEGTRILATGVNGTQAGSPNCCEMWKGKDLTVEPYRSLHREWASTAEIHAEINAINRLPHNYRGVLQLSTAVISRNPCSKCAHALVVHGIDSINVFSSDESNTPDKALNDIPVFYWLTSDNGGYYLYRAYYKGNQVDIGKINELLSLNRYMMLIPEIPYNNLPNLIRNYF